MYVGTRACVNSMRLHIYDRWAVVAPTLSVLGIGFMLALPVLSTILSNATKPDIQVPSSLTLCIFSIGCCVGLVTRGRSRCMSGENRSGHVDLLDACILIPSFHSSRICREGKTKFWSL